MPDGEVAIDIPNGKESSVLFLCESDGGALCLVNIEGSHRRARYSDTKHLPDGFIIEALDELQLSVNAPPTETIKPKFLTILAQKHV